MSFDRRGSRPRPFYKSLFDALVFTALLAMVVFALKLSGFFTPQTGDFIAIDGDSLRKGDEDFRLFGIDAPELHETCTTSTGHEYACGLEAKRNLVGLVQGQTLTCAVVDTDRYGRGVARCRAGELDIAAEMVRRGWAIAYVKHSTAYVDEEAEARHGKRGIWQGSFETPEDWRARHRGPVERSAMD